MVGLYGDPDSAWSIAVDLALLDPVAPDDLVRRSRAMSASHPHLGRPASVLVTDEEEEYRRAAARGYEVGEPLVRLVSSTDGRRVLVAAHHGAVDGLGLLGIARLVLDLDLRSNARGIGRRPSATGFWRSSLQRLGEAVVAPPVRFGGEGDAGAAGEENLASRTFPPMRASTSSLAAAVLSVHHHSHVGAPGRAVLAVGASRRDEPRPTPDRDTAYFRLRLPTDTPFARVAAILSSLPPEPDFPETSAGGVGPLVTRALRGRLGSTATLSNLGIVTGPVRAVAMYPALNGPRAVGVGLASTSASTTLTLRTRRTDFAVAEHERLLAALAGALQAEVPEAGDAAQ